MDIRGQNHFMGQSYTGLAQMPNATKDTAEAATELAAGAHIKANQKKN